MYVCFFWFAFQSLYSTHSSDTSGFATTGRRGSPLHHFSLVAEEESPEPDSVDLEDSPLLPSKNSNPTTPKLTDDEKSISLADEQGSPSHQSSKAVEEDQTSQNSVSADCDSPILPPKGVKLSKSVTVDGEKSVGPPVIPRRLSVPHARQAVTLASPTDDGCASLSAAHSQDPTAPNLELPRRTAVDTATDSPTAASRDVAPTPLPRWPMSQVKRSLRAVPRPADSPTDTTMPLDLSESCIPASLLPKQISPEGCGRDTESTADCILPESEMNPVAAPSDIDSTDVSTPRKSVFEIKCDIDARTSEATGIQPETDAKPGIPSRRLVIPAAFQNSTV